MAIKKNPPFPNNYAKEFLVLDHGKGSYLYDSDGRAYLDFAGGIAVNSLGYGNKSLEKSITEQVKKLIHVSNLFTTQPAVDLATMLTRSSPLEKDQPWEAGKDPGYFQAVHFGNSGTEANEGAIKYARLYASRKKNPNGHKILACTNGFHGRTLGALSATHTEKYRKPFEPLIPGIEFVPLNDAEGLKSILNRDFCGVIVEPVQGEGGLTCMTKAFAQELNRLCNELDIVLIADEVQTGLGRTGTLFASQSCGLEPDIITLSKPLAGGLPLSATLLPQKVNELVQIGDHGTTFGGGPVTCAAAITIWETLNSPGFLEVVREKSQLLEDGLADLIADSDKLGFMKGRGLLRGVEVRDPELLPNIINRAKELGLLVLRSGSNVIRLAPPLTIKDDELYDGLRILRTIMEEV